MIIINKNREEVIEELAVKKTLKDTTYFDVWIYQGFVETFSRMSCNELQDVWNCVMLYPITILDGEEKIYEPTCPKANI